MKNKFNFLCLLVAGLSLSILFNACSKSSSANGTVAPGTQKASIYLTDGPGAFDKVLVDIVSVQVMVDTCASAKDSTTINNDRRHGDDDNRNHLDSCIVWDSLSITPGIYDLLTLRNGVDTLLAGGTLPAGKIIQIKIQLGPNDSIVLDSVAYPLNFPSNQPPYILINLTGNEWDRFEPGHVRLWLDFNIARSIFNLRNNEFFLQPFLCAFTPNTSGAVEGRVTPKDALPVVTVYNSSDTTNAIPGGDGEFQARGLTPGTYSVSVTASNGYADTTITGVNVTAGQEVNLGTINLHK